MNKPSATDWVRVDGLTDDQIDRSDVPELPESFFARAQWRPPCHPESLLLHVDPEVLAWFQAQGDNWEERVNAALRLYMEAHRRYSAQPESAA